MESARISNLLRFRFAGKKAWNAVSVVGDTKSNIEGIKGFGGFSIFWDADPNAEVLAKIDELSNQMKNMEQNMVRRLEELHRLLKNLPYELSTQATKEHLRIHIEDFDVTYDELRRHGRQRLNTTSSVWNSFAIPMSQKLQTKLNDIRILLVTSKSHRAWGSGLLMTIANRVAVSILLVVYFDTSAK